MAAHPTASSATHGLSVYEIIIPTLIRGLTLLDGLLTAAAKHAEAESGSPDEKYAAARLAEDMLPFTFQIQAATNTSKLSIKRLTGKELPSWADDEKTFAQLHERLAKALALLKEQTPEEFQQLNVESAKVHLDMRVAQFDMSAQDYVLRYALPNFFFHVQTAYSILRNHGVPLGKQNYLAPFLKGP